MPHERAAGVVTKRSSREHTTGATLRRAGLGLGALALLSCSDAVGPVVPTPTSLTLQASSVAFTALGQTEQLTASVRDQQGAPMSGVTLTWTSRTESVASVSGTGLVTAVGPGTAVITVAAETTSASLTVTVEQVAASLALSADVVSMSALGDTLRLVATVMDSGGNVMPGAVVSWTSLDASVATVGIDGVVTAVTNGATTIAAISGATLATSAITVAQIAGAVTLSADTLDFGALGDTTQLAVTVTDAAGAGIDAAVVAWTSSDVGVATVSPGGLVTSVTNGTATITATSDGVIRIAHVAVQQVPSTISLQLDSLVLSTPGDTAPLAASVRDALGVAIVASPVTWTSTDSAVATVSGTGLVTAVATGTVVVTAVAGTVSAQVTARVEPEVTLVAAGLTALSSEVATEVALSVRVEDLLGAAYLGATVTWSTGAASGSISSESETVSDPTGHAGAVWLLGTTAGSQQATASLTSRGNVVEVSFTAAALAGPPTTAVLIADSILISARGETAFLAPTHRDAFGNTSSGSGLVWVSRDPAVATVAADGLVTGVATGSTYVTAGFGPPSDSILVTVAMRGAITITFDDGFITAFTNAWPVFQEFGLPGNVGVNPAQVGFPTYMTMANLDELHAAGWSMVSHTMTHDTLITRSAAQLDFELRASQQWIDDQGYRGSNVFIVPFHIWGARERDAIGTIYEATRGFSVTQVTPDSLVSWQPSNPFDLTGMEADLLPFTSLAGRNRLRAQLQRTLDEGLFLDLFFHRLLSADVAAFRATLAVVNEFRDRVLPYHELYPRFARSVF